MASRGIPFWEFQERVQPGRFKANAVTGLWNWLALTFCVVKARGDAPAKCDLPFDDIMNLTPREMKQFRGVGSARLAVYKVFHQSLVAKPAALPPPTDPREVTRENLGRFASRENDSSIGKIWNEFLRADVSGFGKEPSLERLEAYCDSLKSSGRFANHYKLLSQWLTHLKKYRQ